MIALQELRLGNKVLRNGIVVNVDNQTFWDIEKYPDQYEPIELTEDWLLKMGFEKLVHKYYKLGDYSVSMPKDEIRFIICNYMESPPSVKIKHVHQLQNLFHSLCGEELTIKEQS
ncbi:Uncharacterised protein [Chryseobacterium nakagawai]|uniref:Uncharacterized protein n=1 Tax=Chryseobacterium nakagawai TaxID=1241982 RepID=A0AAD1DQV8_CHRNA|nr:hypothetical protein [Chryseobacterium nakagawai]AZA91146.1 hypothetical protein EG343_11145 [Chryseobacterium nakagawai]VEH22706.1 Uncharacterised protein [Chryseobacterium nakagawai]